MYFVMLNHPSDDVEAIPLETGRMGYERIAFFDTKEDADVADEESRLGEQFGWEVFCLGKGE